jgi:hypothetical protein
LKRYPVIKRRLSRYYGEFRELAIPPELLHIAGSSVYQWINKNGNIEISNQQKGTKDINGLFVSRELHAHGGSYVVMIHNEIRNAFKIMNKKLEWVEISVNERDNLEIKSFSNKS